MNTITFLSALGGAEFLIIIIGLVIYFIPCIVGRNNRNASTVFLVNLFFGWTLLGWVIALILAISDSKETVVVHGNNKADKYDQLQKLDELRTKGIISTEEFIIEKEKIMKG